jgi:hypothetical protein
MTPSWEETSVMLVSRDIRHLLAVDRQSDDEIISKVRCPLNNETRAFAATACLRLTTCDKDWAKQNQNAQDSPHKIPSHPTESISHSAIRIPTFFEVAIPQLNPLD